MFSDEVWATGSAYITSYVTVKEDGSDRYQAENLQHKYLKKPAWRFHGIIINGRKDPARFWKKDWGNNNSATYNEYILSYIDQFFQEYTGAGYIFMQDNAPAHRSARTRLNLATRRIPYVKFPPYSPDLNLTEHV